MEKPVNGINVAVRSANVDERNEYLLSFYTFSKSLKMSVHVTVYCHGKFGWRAAVVIQKLEMAKHKASIDRIW